ncbi:MAG: hypothetical protein IKU56_02690 [Clostridia bacterium]|nr:hypothetical protein [Clostridia bacterium]
MKVFADAVVPSLFSKDTALVMLPYVLIILLFGVSIAVIRLVLRKNNVNGDQAIPPETTDSSDNDSCES